MRLVEATNDEYDWFITSLCVIAKNGKRRGASIATELDTLHAEVTELSSLNTPPFFRASVVLEWMKAHKPSAMYVMSLAFGRSDIYASEIGL